MIKASVEPWVEEPLSRFVKDAGVQLSLLLLPSGQVMAQYGFTRALDVMSACALAAAIFASSSEMGRLLNGKAFSVLHAGGKPQYFLAEARTARGPYIFLTVFDQESSLGLVRLFFDEFKVRLAAAAPPPVAQEPVLASNFEGELNRNLAVLFGRA
ncbi:MAG TPA: hypothetical protein VF483_06560 [Gemmatimonadaceae bacterium]